MAMLPKNEPVCPVCSGPDMLGMVHMKCHRYHLQCLVTTLSKGRSCAAAGCNTVWGYATFYHLGLEMYYKNSENVVMKDPKDGENQDLSEMNLEKIHSLPAVSGIHLFNIVYGFTFIITRTFIWISWIVIGQKDYVFWTQKFYVFPNEICSCPTGEMCVENIHRGTKRGIPFVNRVTSPMKKAALAADGEYFF